MAGKQKPYKGIAMEGFIATWYAKNAAGDRDELFKQAQTVAQHVPSGGRILEVAPGPGYLALELAKLGNFEVTGLDISHTFVRMARQAAQKAGAANVEFMQGDVAVMPFSANTFDFVVCRAAFKNFGNPVRALNEMHRVLKLNGQALIIDLRKDASNEEIENYIQGRDMSAFTALITRMTFRRMLRPRAYSRDDFAAMIGKTPFQHYEFKERGIGLEVWLRAA